MVSIKLKFRPSSKKDSEGSVYFQIIYARKVRQLGIGLKITPTIWKFISQQPLSELSNVCCGDVETGNVQRIISLEYTKIKTIVSELENNRVAFVVDDIIRRYQRKNVDGNLFLYIKRLMDLQTELGNYRQKEIYNTLYNSLMRYTNGCDVSLASIDAHFVLSYEAYLKQRVIMNTSSFYMRNFRAVYNRAVEDGLVEQIYPFKHVYTGVDKTAKRAVSLPVIRKLKNIDLNNKPNLAFARDMFLFSFYTRGMAFIDMAYLKKNDLQNGRLVYSRRKTKQKLFIKWEKCMQNIVKRYFNPNTPYMLPILFRAGDKERNDYRNMSHKINGYLRIVSAMIGLDVPLTMYVARHAWASIAKSKNIPLSVISEGMGHDSEATTRIYLATLDTQAVDRANNIIINSL